MVTYYLFCLSYARRIQTWIAANQSSGVAILRGCMQNACMPSITIRNVPDETHEELAARAAASGKSLQEYLRAELIRVGFEA